MTRRRNPFPGVTRVTNRHGKVRWRFRRGGFTCYLPGPYASAEWRAAYPMPEDYDRVVLGSEADDPATWFWGYEPFQGVNDWMRYKNGGFQMISPGGWILMGGEIHFHPVPSGRATFPYNSNHWARSEDGEAQGFFDADDDTFVLPEASDALSDLALQGGQRPRIRRGHAELRDGTCSGAEP